MSSIFKESPSKEQLETELDAWKNLKINIGLIGSKSDLKNVLIGKLIGVEPLSSQESDETKVLENTALAIPYLHSNNVNLIVWDMKASNKVDLERLDLNKYDLIIFFRDKPKSSDDELIKSVEDCGKKCIVVTFDSPSRFDFSKLQYDIMQALMLLTRDHINTYGLSIQPINKQIIEVKRDILRSRIEKIAWLSSMFGHIFSFNRFNILCDFAKLASEIWLYRDQLGLSPQILTEMTTSAHHKISEIISKSKFASMLVLKDLNSLTSVLIKALPVLIVSNDAVDLLRVLPAAENLLHGTISFAAQKLALINILEEFTKISTDLHSLSEKTKIVMNSELNSAGKKF